MAREHRVAVVVDPDYGKHVRDLSRDRHVWIVRSPVNDAVVEVVRAQAEEYSLDSGISTFAAGESPEASFLSILGAVEEHHGEHSHDPPLGVIQIIGVDLTPGIRAELAAYGFDQVESAHDEVVARRPV